MLNQITLMGRLTRDPEARQAGSTTAVNFSLAVERDYAPQGGDRQTDFIDCVAFGKNGEFVQKYFTKGRMACVTGRLQIRDWTDKDGGKRRSAEVLVDHTYFADSKSGGAAPQSTPQRAVSVPEPGEEDVSDSDLPF